jgi:hypothetical protein
MSECTASSAPVPNKLAPRIQNLIR